MFGFTIGFITGVALTSLILGYFFGKQVEFIEHINGCRVARLLEILDNNVWESQTSVDDVSEQSDS